MHSAFEKKVDKPPLQALPSFLPHFALYLLQHLDLLLDIHQFKMGVEKKILKAGNGVDFPKEGEKVAMHYTGCLYDEKAEHKMGTK
jgi:hypothetical protein